MSRRITKILSLLLSSFFIFAPTASAQTSAWTQGTCVRGYGSGAQDVATIQGLECLVGNILATAITIIGIAAFVMFLIGSFRYLTAGNNTKGVEGGKNAISFAILGIVVALASFILLRFVSEFTGVTSFLNFSTQTTP